MIVSRYRAWLEDGRPEDLESELAQLLPALSGQARRLLRHASDADDAVQDAMVELLRTRRQIPRELPFQAVAYRLVRERALMRGRSVQRRRRREATLTDVPVGASAEARPDGPPDPADIVAALSLHERQLLDALLASDDRQTVAAQLGITTSQVAVSLHRLRRRLGRATWAPLRPAASATS